MNIEWRPEAEADRDRIIDFIGAENPFAARQILAAMIDKIDSLAEFSHRGRAGLVPGTRELVALHPFVIVYDVNEETRIIRILRIWHTAQDR